MITVIFSLVSLVIITPVVLFFPLGLSIKWKLSLIGVALLLANVGLMASVQLPLYQTLLIIFLLSSLMSILLAKRIPNIPPKQIDLGLGTKTYLPLENKPLHIENNIKENSVKELAAVLDMTAAASEIYQNDRNEFIENERILQGVEEVKEIDQVDKANQLVAIEENDPAQSDSSLDLCEDIAFLESRAKDFSVLESRDITIEKNDRDSENNYMSEIEKLMEADEQDLDFTDELQEDHDFVPKAEMEELEEIEVANIVTTSKNDEIDEKYDNEVEIEELVFHK